MSPTPGYLSNNDEESATNCKLDLGICQDWVYGEDDDFLLVSVFDFKSRCGFNVKRCLHTVAGSNPASDAILYFCSLGGQCGIHFGGDDEVQHVIFPVEISKTAKMKMALCYGDIFIMLRTVEFCQSKLNGVFILFGRICEFVRGFRRKRINAFSGDYAIVGVVYDNQLAVIVATNGERLAYFLWNARQWSMWRTCVCAQMLLLMYDYQLLRFIDPGEAELKYHCCQLWLHWSMAVVKVSQRVLSDGWLSYVCQPLIEHVCLY